MGTITLPYTFIAGQTPTATNWNANPTTIATLVNGQIDKANVDSSSSDGIVTMDETQSISGAKTFSGAVINTGGVTIKDTDNAAGSIQTNLTLEWDPGDGAQMTDNSSGVGIDFKMPDASDNQTVFASLDVLCLDDSASSEDGEFSFKTVVNASEAEVLTLSGAAATFTIPVTVGVDDTGHDVKFFGATSGKYMLWDEDADSLLVSGDIDMVANGNRIDLDTDNDTSIRASADDTISIEVAGADDFTITANSLNVLTGSVIDLADNAPVQFGDADDASIKWDATDLAIAAGSADVKITASNVIPATNDGSALGVSGTAWSDLFLASGSVVDFHAGDVTLTHSANTLTLAGGALSLNDGNISNVGQIDVDSIVGDNDANTNITFAGSDIITVATGGSERMRVGAGGTLYLNDDENGKMNGQGITINQAANDLNTFDLKSSDVAHGRTSHAETDTYFSLAKYDGNKGGCLQYVMMDNEAQAPCYDIRVTGGQAVTNAAASNCIGLVTFRIAQHNGSNSASSMTAGGFPFVVRCHDAADTDSAVFAVDEDGDLYAGNTNDSIAMSDDKNDPALLRGFDHAIDELGLAKGMIKNRWDDFVKTRDADLVELGVLGDTVENGGLYCVTQHTRLMNSAIWQVYSMLLDVIDSLPTETQNKIRQVVPNQLLLEVA